MKYLIIFSILICFVGVCGAEEVGMASWYSRASCQKEFGKNWDGICANGKELIDNELTCASWDYPFGTKLRITNVSTKHYTIVTVADRGPAKRLYRMGRIIDLSKGAFREIADLQQGLIQVRVEEIK